MIRYLSLEWIDALSSEVAANESLQRLSSETSIGVTQVVTDGPEGDVVYHLQVGNGAAAFGAGAAYPQDVRFEQTWATAVAVATNSLNAQDAFIKGHITLTGDHQKLLSNGPVFEALDGIFSVVRERTTYE